jgi:hypothetical protein
MKRQFCAADPPCLQSLIPLLQAPNLLDPRFAGEIGITVATQRQNTSAKYSQALFIF